MANVDTPTAGGVNPGMLVVRSQEGKALQSRLEHGSPKEFFQNREKTDSLNLWPSFRDLLKHPREPQARQLSVDVMYSLIPPE
jgi:hypothetical protein